MIESVETIKDVEKQLGDARAKLQAFEDGVDRTRLLKRLKVASPAHPILLFRAMFLMLTMLMLGTALTVLIIPFVNGDLARRIAKFDALVPVPPDVPGLPALLGGLALCMGVGWLMTTMAALAMGRDAQMLPWEQKQHQKLVNEVTRLTTQKAVMERMRSTPAGARPRIETPVPVSLRDRTGMATPSALSRLGDGGGSGPPSIGGGMRPGRFGSGGAGGGGVNNPFGRAPGSVDPASGAAGGGTGGMFGQGPAATPPGAPPAGAFGSAPSAPGGGGGVLARARSGALKTTPAGAAGRLSPNFNRGSSPPPDEEGSDDGGPFGSGGGYSPPAAAPPTGNPFGARPAAPSQGGNPFARPSAGNAPASASSGGNPFGGPPASNPFDEPDSFDDAPATGGAPAAVGVATSARAGRADIFGTPPPVGNPRPGGGLLAQARASGNPMSAQRGAESDVPSIVDSSPRYSSEADSVDEHDEQATETYNRKVKLPTWGAIDDPWLEESIERSEELARALPMQAHLLFSDEAYLPFTLVLARAAPTVAVKALVSFVEFLSAIPTPPRARIELSSSPGLDRSFHRNVEAALQPIYQEDFDVDLEPGRIEITFKKPDAAWQDHPILPME